MPDWLLRIEAVNFSATMNDTNDLSTQRGASLTALNAGEAVEGLLRRLQGEGKIAIGRIERVFIGASQALFRLEGVADAGPILQQVRAFLRPRQRLATNKPIYGTVPPVDWMTFVADAVRTGSRALREVEALNRRRQFQSPTLAPHPKAGAGTPTAAAHRRACPIEFRLPADTEHSVRKDVLNNAILVRADPKHNEKKVLLAASVAERRSYGRTARQLFYDDVLKARKRVHFADGLIDLVGCPPPALPLPLRDKMAVITADGIGFGDMLKKLQQDRGDIDGLKTFSDEVERVNREAILGPLIDCLAAAHAADDERALAVSIPFRAADNPEARRSGWSPILRLETLTYAGEDIVWLMPSWLAWEITGFLLSATGKAVIGEIRPRYRVGVAICSYKMPIRKACALAHELEYLVTDGVPDAERRAGCQVELVESIDISDGYLGDHRALLAGPGNAGRFTVAADDFDEVTSHVEALRHPRGLPPSQLHRLLRLAAHLHAFTDPNGRATVAGELERTLKRNDYRYGRGDAGRRLTCADLAHPGLGAADDPLFGLLRVAQLWDVVLPLGMRVLEEGGP